MDFYTKIDDSLRIAELTLDNFSIDQGVFRKRRTNFVNAFQACDFFKVIYLVVFFIKEDLQFFVKNGTISQFPKEKKKRKVCSIAPICYCN